MKARRQAAILDLVAHEAIENQKVLQRRLRALGFRATQATLSRDLAELGLLKRAGEGGYQAAGQSAAAPTSAAALERAARDSLLHLDRVQQLVVLKTGAGQAQPLALALDRAALPGLVGTIAGDDTVLAIARTPRQAAAMVRHVEGFLR